MTKKRGSKKEVDVALKALDLLQEIVWAIRSRESDELVSGVAYLRKLAETEIETTSGRPSSLSNSSKGLNLRALVGLMPLVLADSELFPTNADIKKFADEALQISIVRWEKRSRYEMIGMLVMESIHATPGRLKQVTLLLNEISGDPNSFERFKRTAQQTGFSWNQAIRSLTGLKE